MMGEWPIITLEKLREMARQHALHRASHRSVVEQRRCEDCDELWFNYQQHRDARRCSGLDYL